MTGTLYLIATPIGNLEDITFRAVRTMREVTLIASEDTRRTKRLLAHYDIQTKLVSYHDHSSPKTRERLISELKKGVSICLVSDAGTPLINDPGFRLVKRCIEESVPIISVPGPTAAIVALTVSGAPSDKFMFWGYLSQKQGKRRKELQIISQHTVTTICLESPHRIIRTLDDMNAIMSERYIAVCREMTKKFEEITRGTVAEVYQKSHVEKPRGEYTIVISPATK